jgi:AbrB family looped-hinge helix DNA binding protein
MPRSTITAKYQTTVPKEIRDKLGLAPRDVLHWEIVDGCARIRPADTGFLEKRGSIRIGPGSAVEDVKSLRKIRGTR